jgi:integrase
MLLSIFSGIKPLETHHKRQLAEATELGNAWQPKSKEFAGLVFTSEVGTEINPFNLYRTWYELQTKTRNSYVTGGKTEEEKKARAKQVAENIVFQHLRLHDLRHLHVSLLNKAGVDARTIADRVGHKNADFTLKRYAHVFDEQRQAAAIPLNKLLGDPD